MDSIFYTIIFLYISGLCRDVLLLSRWVVDGMSEDCDRVAQDVCTVYLRALTAKDTVQNVHARPPCRATVTSSIAVVVTEELEGEYFFSCILLPILDKRSMPK